VTHKVLSDVTLRVDASVSLLTETECQKLFLANKNKKRIPEVSSCDSDITRIGNSGNVLAAQCNGARNYRNRASVQSGMSRTSKHHLSSIDDEVGACRQVHDRR